MTRLGILRLAAVVAAVAGVTLLFFRLIPVNATTAGFAYLVAILMMASGWGLAEGILASALSILCFNFFFLPPVGTFTIADPQNWIALVAFLAAAIIASQLSNRARRRTLDAVASQKEMERLYAFSRGILLADPGQDAARQMTREMARIFDLEGVALYSRHDGQTYYAGEGEWDGFEEKLKETALQGGSSSEAATRTIVLAIRLGGSTIGALALRGAPFSDAALQSICNLVAIGLERVRAQETANRAQVARQSDQLKSTLLDAIAHEFQTPLTSIRAAATELVAGPAIDSEAQRELLRVIDEESGRLSRLVTEAIQMARIETGKVRLNRAPGQAGELVKSVLDKMEGRMEGRAVEVKAPPGLPAISVDGEMMEMALRQLIDNAVKYSTPGTPLTIEAREDGGAVVVSVTDRGPGIPEYEQTRIFEKFYRRRGAGNEVTGSGMGLAIAREIVHAHGGEIWVDSKPGEGSRFSISLPGVAEAIR